jgi:hypothetical protein
MKHRTSGLVAAFAILCLTVPAGVAHDHEGQGASDAAAAEMMAKWAAYAEPGEHHELLEQLVGRWEATTSWWPEPGAEPTVSKGVAEWTWRLGKRYLEGHYESEFMGQPFEGWSIDGYDKGKDQYFGIWMDTMGTGYMLSHGTCDLDSHRCVYSGSMYDPAKGEEVEVRSVSEAIDDDTIEFTMYEIEGGQEQKVMHIRYERM